MAKISYRCHHFPAQVIQHAVWLYLRFSLSYRDVGDLLAERGLDLSYETIRRWVLKFGPAFARELGRRRPRPSSQWHLDEMVVRIGGEPMYLWYAVDDEGKILDMLCFRKFLKDSMPPWCADARTRARRALDGDERSMRDRQWTRPISSNTLTNPPVAENAASRSSVFRAQARPRSRSFT
jgi:hypothetical protein